MKAEIVKTIEIYKDMIRHLRLKIETSQREISDIEDNIVAAECSIENFAKCKSIEIPHKHFVKLKIRKGSRLYTIMRLIFDANRPLHLDEICKLLGGDWPANKKDSLRGNLNGACSELRIFVRTAPQTYGLLELNHKEEKHG